MTTLDDYLDASSPLPPNVMKVDIEGAEVDMLEGSQDCISRYRPLIFLAVHSPQLMKEVEKICASIEYSMLSLEGEYLKPGDYAGEVQLIPDGWKG